jgi:hypothetical protein
LLYGAASSHPIYPPTFVANREKLSLQAEFKWTPGSIAIPKPGAILEIPLSDCHLSYDYRRMVALAA